MRIEKLLPKTQEGLRKWARAVMGDELYFDSISGLLEQWTCMWFELRESEDRPEWFPSGKWATLQRIESLLAEEARGALCSRDRDLGSLEKKE